MNTPLLIRQAIQHDAATLSDLILSNATRTLRAYYSPEQWEAFISYYSVKAMEEKISDQKVFCGVFDGEIIGTIGLDSNFLVGFYMRFDKLNRGFGVLLLQYIEAFALKEGFNAIQLAASPVAVAYYLKNGWQIVEEVTIAYRGVPFLETLMVKSLA